VLVARFFSEKVKRTICYPLRTDVLFGQHNDELLSQHHILGDQVGTAAGQV
jgi:hypothetical protein